MVRGRGIGGVGFQGCEHVTIPGPQDFPSCACKVQDSFAAEYILRGT